MNTIAEYLLGSYPFVRIGKCKQILIRFNTNKGRRKYIKEGDG